MLVGRPTLFVANDVDNAVEVRTTELDDDDDDDEVGRASVTENV